MNSRIPLFEKPPIAKYHLLLIYGVFALPAWLLFYSELLPTINRSIAGIVIWLILISSIISLGWWGIVTGKYLGIKYRKEPVFVMFTIIIFLGIIYVVELFVIFLVSWSWSVNH